MAPWTWSSFQPILLNAPLVFRQHSYLNTFIPWVKPGGRRSSTSIGNNYMRKQVNDFIRQYRFFYISVVAYLWSYEMSTKWEHADTCVYFHGLTWHHEWMLACFVLWREREPPLEVIETVCIHYVNHRIVFLNVRDDMRMMDDNIVWFLRVRHSESLSITKIQKGWKKISNG